MKSYLKLISKQCFKNKLFRYNEKFKANNKQFSIFDFVDIFNDKRRLFQISIIHDNDDKSKTSKLSKKFAQFVKISI